MSSSASTTTPLPSARRPEVSAPGKLPPAPSRSAGWAGLGFVALMLVCEAALTLPATTHTDDYIRSFYTRSRWAVLATQLGELVATWFLWLFVRGLADRLPTGPGVTRMRISGLLLCAGSALTAAPVLALAAGLGSAGSARFLISWTDDSDVVMSFLIALFGAACLVTLRSVWARAGAAALALLSLARAVLILLGQTTLSNLAPTAFLLFVLVLGITMTRRGQRARRVVDAKVEG